MRRSWSSIIDSKPNTNAFTTILKIIARTTSTPSGYARISNDSTPTWRRVESSERSPPFFFPTSELLGRRAADVLGARTFRTLSDVELDAVTLTKVVEPLAIDGTLVKEILLACIVFDEAKPLVDS